MRFFLPNSTTSSTIPFSGPIIKFLNTIWIVNSPPPLLRQHEKCMCCKWNEEQVFIKGLDCAVSVILFWGEEEKLEITQMLSRCLPKSTLPAAEPSRRSRLKIGYRAENKTLHLTILANNARSRKIITFIKHQLNCITMVGIPSMLGQRQNTVPRPHLNGRSQCV